MHPVFFGEGHSPLRAIQGAAYERCRRDEHPHSGFGLWIRDHRRRRRHVGRSLQQQQQRRPGKQPRWERERKRKRLVERQLQRLQQRRQQQQRQLQRLQQQQRLQQRRRSGLRDEPEPSRERGRLDLLRLRGRRWLARLHIGPGVLRRRRGQVAAERPVRSGAVPDVGHDVHQRRRRGRVEPAFRSSASRTPTAPRSTETPARRPAASRAAPRAANYTCTACQTCACAYPKAHGGTGIVCEQGGTAGACATPAKSRSAQNAGRLSDRHDLYCGQVEDLPDRFLPLSHAPPTRAPRARACARPRRAARVRVRVIWALAVERRLLEGLRREPEEQDVRGRGERVDDERPVLGSVLVVHVVAPVVRRVRVAEDGDVVHAG